MAEALRVSGGGGGVQAVDLLCCDEAHRCTGRPSKRDAQPLRDDFIRASRRLFLTATPKLIGAARDAEGELVSAGSMDDEALFGRVAYRLGYSEAVRSGVVAPLKLVFLNVSEAYARLVAAAPWKAIAVTNATAAQRQLVELSAAMLDCRDRYGARTAFVFCSTNARAAALEKVASATLASRGITLSRVSGTMDTQRRLAALEPVRRAVMMPTEGATTGGAATDDMASVDSVVIDSTANDGAITSSMSIVTNCRVLGEGVDLPAVDLVVFADAKHSHVDILQCMGRASRLAPNKEFGHVLVPVAEVGDEDGAFETVVSVVRAYAEMDEEFREALAALVVNEARLGRPLSRSEWPVPLQRVIDLGVLELDDGGLSLGGERLLRTVATKLVDRWEWMYGLLCAFYEREGHANVPSSHKEDDEALGGWLQRQKHQHKLQMLQMVRRRRLEELGVTWDVLWTCFVLRRRGIATTRCFVRFAHVRAMPMYLDITGRAMCSWGRGSLLSGSGTAGTRVERGGVQGEECEPTGRRGSVAAGGARGGVGRVCGELGSKLRAASRVSRT